MYICWTKADFYENLILETVTQKLDWSESPPPKKKKDERKGDCASSGVRSPDLTRAKPMTYLCTNLSDD